MEFRKKIKIESAENEVTHQSKLISLGSCFSENIGAKLNESSFSILQNPQGIIFNPIALADAFLEVDSNDVFIKNEQAFSWMHHSSISGSAKNTLVDVISKSKNEVRNYLNQATHVFVTFGSAWGYRHHEINKVVANCHKMPQQDFKKELTSVQDIVTTWTKIITDNPQINWVFTVSPVRHWKDGVRENNVSKGVLHQSIHQLLELENVNYFPAYEIIMDELRDYRFFKNDMLHPNELAVDYVWEKFGETYFSKETTHVNTEVEKLNRMLAHKVMSGNTLEIEKFEDLVAKQKLKINLLLRIS